MNEESIFAAAIERKSPVERAAYLDGACGDDMPLRERVEALLHSHEDAGTFLKNPAVSAETIDSQIPETAGTRIGPYKLLQKIGESSTWPNKKRQ